LNRGNLIVRTRRQGFVALVGHLKPAPDELVLVDPVSLKVMRRLKLPRKVVFRQVAVDPSRQRLIVVGNARRDHRVVAVTVADDFRTSTRPRLLRRSAAGAFRVNTLSVSPDGARLLVSYHGTNTTGADLFSLPSWNRCGRAPARAGCILTAHGQASFVGTQIIATTGTPPALEGFNGLRRTWRVALTPSNAHVLTFAVAGGFLYVPGGCDYPRGIWKLDVRMKSVRHFYSGLPTPAIPEPPCGDTISLSDDHRWAITTETALPVPDPERSGSVWLIDLSHRLLPTQIPVAVDPVAASFIAG
jgi:hypothetical protein